MASSKRFFAPEFDKAYFGTGEGFVGWLKSGFKQEVTDRLAKLSREPLSKVQLNQLLVLSQDASISDGFFKYYWRTTPEHPYDTSAISGFDGNWLKTDDQVIVTLEHFAWGLHRVYMDSLLFFGNIRAGFSSLRSLNFSEITEFFFWKRFDTTAIAARGPALPLNQISKDDRYLISEMACKTFGEVPKDAEEAKNQLRDALQSHEKSGGGRIAFKQLLEKYIIKPSNKDQLFLSYDDVINEDIDSEKQLIEKVERILKIFAEARKRAIQNTGFYLSMINDLDVYVATSMRSRKNFRDMADACDRIFSNRKLGHLHLRYFDPTLSAAKGHEDKGLIECLMVKCAKVLVYCEGEKESYGKDAEAAMALSLGKPVIFYCDHGVKTNFYRDVHPLARLIDFRSGVAVGAMVSDDVDEVAELLLRIFSNQMKFHLEHHSTRPSFLKLVEDLTGSVVRLQTDDSLLTETFWNNYHNRARRVFRSLIAGKEAERIQE